MKKKIALSICLIVLYNISFAQLNKGSKNFGATLSFQYNKGTETLRTGLTEHYELQQYSFVPQIGFIRSNHFSWGIGAGYDYKKRTSDQIETTNSAILNPFMRFYKMFEKVGFFAQTDIYLAYGFKEHEIKYNEIFFTENFEQYEGKVGISPGIIFFLNNRFSIETTTGFLGIISHKDEYENYLSIAIMKPQVKFSFQIYVHKKVKLNESN